MHNKISLADARATSPGLSREDFLEALRIAQLLVEQHGSNAPIHAAYRLYCLADLGEMGEFNLTVLAMKFVETVRPDILVFRDT